jgi:branched-chain amino acid transport system permease protein
MSLEAFLFQALNGLASASSLFFVGAGLSLIFGVTRIINIAHGSFYMLGLYLAYTFATKVGGVLGFWGGIVAAAMVVAALGALIEIVLLRRIYQAPELFQLLATFALVLVINDAAQVLWGPEDLLGPRAPGLRGSVEILGRNFPSYDLFLIVVGPAVLLLLHLMLAKTRFGRLIRAATQDREMVAALGVNQALLFTGTLFLGAFLAGIGGALQIARAPASNGMDLTVITDTFVVTVIGGMGSVPGAFLAALIIGLLQAFGILIFPKITLVLVFLLMAFVLVVKPWGLLGRPDTAAGRAILPDGVLNLKGFGTAAKVAAAIALVAVLLLPLFGDAYQLKVGIEVMAFALAAFSLNFLAGIGGIISFGHAAYFGVGAYAAGLLVKQLGLPMEPALVAAPIAGAAFAALFGYFVVRLSGIYLAMLTLAFAQIVYAVCFQWVEVTGGDNGIVGVWPSAWASSRVIYFYLVAAVSVAAIVLMRRVIYAPFGYTLRAARDSAVRADAIGIDVRTHRWLAFTLSGAAAGLAGGLYAFSKGSIDPTMISISMSIDFLVMVLVGGIQTVIGPLLGAAVFHSVKDFFMPLTDTWRFWLGLSIIVMVVAFPRGLAGAGDMVRAWRERRAGSVAGAPA